MKFHTNTVEFSAFGVPMVGNLDTGYVIGLTSEGQRICHRLFSEGTTQEEVRAIDERLLEHLQRGGFFEAQEQQISCYTAYIHVTNRCNLNCTGCYSFDSTRNNCEDLSLEDIQSIMDYLRGRGVQRLIISGGEPFLRDDLADIIKYAKTVSGFDTIEVLTNGTLVSDSVLSRIGSYVNRISISFDGASSNDQAFIRGDQRFASLINALHRIRMFGIKCHILPTIHARNISDIARYKDLAKSQDATISFSLFSPVGASDSASMIGFSEATLSQLASQILVDEKGAFSTLEDTPVNTRLSITSGCGAGCKQLSVASNGDIYPCHMLHHSSLSMGNALDANTLEIDDEPSEFPITVDQIEECRSCEIRYFCGGGCRARAFHNTGNLKSKDPYCELMRSFYSNLFDALKSH